MKDDRGKFLTRMSLTQQIFSMIILMLIFLSLFFAFFLSRNIDQTITSTMYSMLEAGQRPLIVLLEKGGDIRSNQDMMDYLAADSVQTTFVFEREAMSFAIKDSDISVGLEDFLYSQSHSLAANAVNTVREGTCFEDGETYYYYLQKVYTERGQVVVGSFMDSTYASHFRDSIVDSTVYLIIIVFFLMLMILVIWVFSIIRPLNQIRHYIQQINAGQGVELNINRQDEIGELARELTTMKEELDKQDKAKEEMIHNISHDLKTPIATIKSYSESIKDGIYPYGDLDSSVDVILDNAQRLENKVHNLLYLNRVEYLVSSDASGVVTNMKEVVEEVVLNSAVIRPEIQIITDVDEVFFDGLIEAWRVSIENIMENAFRYARTYIKIIVREHDLRIINDGPKMPEDRIDALFRPYEKGEGGRFGLGLSIVQKVTKANDYLVKGYNTKDGVCFRIYREQPKQKNKNRRISIKPDKN